MARSSRWNDTDGNANRVAAKSNAGYVAYNAARAFVSQDIAREVPLHLRNAPGEQYLPDDMPEVSFYQPTANWMRKRKRKCRSG